MVRSIITKIRKHAVNMPGWRTKRKILVIESDDWGSIRMANADSNERLKEAGVKIDTNYFLKYDTLESKEDLELLFQTLISFRDSKGENLKISPISLVANPNFKKIKDSGFKEYSYFNLAQTYQHVHKDARIIETWKKEGIDKGIFVPQFHGREHLNPLKWFEVLQKNINSEMIAFEDGVLLGEKHNFLPGSKGYMAAFEWHSPKQKQFVLDMIVDGTRLFEETFGFKSVSFASSQAIQNQESNLTLLECGVEFHQLGQYFEPQEDNTLRMKNKFWGAKNEVGQTYWRRNARFEPSKGGQNWVNSCFEEISTAFLWGKPAVISSHRVNYVGGMSGKKRIRNLELLSELVQKVQMKWPEVEFMNSIELSKLLKG